MDLEENSEDGSYSSGYEDENGSESGSESASGTSSSGEGSEEEEEPVLKYKRFAKELVNSISGTGGDRNIVCCIAVHPKVSRAYFLNKAHQHLLAHRYAVFIRTWHSRHTNSCMHDIEIFYHIN